MKYPTPGIKRREFLKKSSQLTAATLLLGLGTNNLLQANNAALTEKSIPNFQLNNGISIPALGFGTNTLNGSVCVASVAHAIEVGYRLFDTAHIYGNETAVGEGIRQSKIDRRKLFITSKLWADDTAYEKTKKAFEVSLNKLGLDYLDLYLIHRPRGDVKGSWKAMEELVEAGKIKAIGVSNFEPDQLDNLLKTSKIKPVVNQIESHVFFHQNDSYNYLKRADIQMEAWSPFAAGRNDIFNNKTLAAIGKQYNKSIAQVCLRWHYQRGVVAIPRSSQKAHRIENLDIFDFELSANDVQTIATLNLSKTQFPEWK